MRSLDVQQQSLLTSPVAMLRAHGLGLGIRAISESLALLLDVLHAGRCDLLRDGLKPHHAGDSKIYHQTTPA